MWVCLPEKLTLKWAGSCWLPLLQPIPLSSLFSWRDWERPSNLWEWLVSLLYFLSKGKYLIFHSHPTHDFLFVCVCVLGGSVLVQRAASESVAASARGDMCDRSLAAPAPSVHRGEPAGLRRPGGSSLGLHTGSQWLIDCDQISPVQLWVCCWTCFLLQDGSLALPSSLHSEVALLVAEAYQKYLTDKPYSGLISEGIKQVARPLFADRPSVWITMACFLFHLSVLLPPGVLSRQCPSFGHLSWGIL